MKASVFFADIWDRINLSDKKRLMGQVRMKYGNNYSQDDLYKLLAQEYQDSAGTMLATGEEEKL